MENSNFVKKIKLILGGALLSAFFFGSGIAFAFDQHNTHPALTDEIVDFYNLIFPDKKLSGQEKEWIIQGSIDEDSAARSLNHFYDPVYDSGIWNNYSSKKWALNSGAQLAWAELTKPVDLYSSLSEDTTAPNGDYSWPRAIKDFAEGNRERAMKGIGHTLHLLEDAGVPDHTRGDAHPGIHSMGSPFETIMAKWNRNNFNIASKLKREGIEPTNFKNLGDYFDYIARYSNSNFFSQDTIDNNKYGKPLTNFTKKVKVNGGNKLFIFGKDEKRDEFFPLAVLQTEEIRNFIEIKNSTLFNKEIGSMILDGYWSRLSPEIVLNGAGALRLFLEEAERAKKEYANKPPEKPSLWAQFLAIFKIGNTTNNINTNSEAVDNQDNQNLLVTQGDTNGVTNTLPLVSPILSPLPKVSPKLSPISTPKIPPSLFVSPSPSLLPKLSTIKKSGKITINEIAWAGTSASAGDEWIELFNAENEPIDISEWKLSAEDGSPDIVFKKDSIIGANSYFLIERTDDNTVSDIIADLAIGFGNGFNNNGEVLSLFNSAGILVDAVGKTGEKWLAGDATEKISMERNGSIWKNFTGVPTNKDAEGNLINGTPRAKNSTGIQVVVSTSGGGGGGSSNSSPSPTPSPTPSVTPTPSLTPSPTPEMEGDNDNGDTANLGDILINEIAWMGTASSANDEWIELHNTTDQTINITGWALKAEDDTPSITLSGSLDPLGFYLLERTDDETLLDINADQIYTGALGNSGENLVLKDVSGTIIDQVDGLNEWKMNGDEEIIGNNETKETAQKFGNVWKTAGSTPGSQNKENISTNAPSAVTNLSATLNSPLSVSWSAPNSGGYNPASLSYDLRYSSVSFSNDDIWEVAVKIASSSLPDVDEEGAEQNISFDFIYEYGETLYFALKTKVTKSPENISEISNIAEIDFPTAIDDSAWVMFGKDQYHSSFASDISGPGLTATISWEFEAGSGVPISQLVADADGNVYFGASDGTLANSKIYSIKKMGENVVENWSYDTNVSIGVPAVLSDGSVYFGRIGAGGVLAFTALNSDGTNKWDFEDASTVKHVTITSKGEAHFTYKSGIFDKIIVLDSDGFLKTSIEGSGFNGFSSVVLENGNIIGAKYLSGNQFFNSYSDTGTQIWENELFFSGANGNLPSHPSHDQSSGKTYSSAGSYLFEIPSNGSILNSEQIDLLGSAATTVGISDSALYVGFNDLNPASGSRLFAIDKSNLTAKWAVPFEAEGRINEQVAIDQNNNIYFSTQSGHLYSVDVNGQENWHISVDENSTVSPVLIQDGIVWGYGTKIVGILP